MALRDIYLLLSDTDIQRFEYDGSGFVLYAGNAQPGSLSSDAAWRIKQFTNNGSGQPTLITFPNGSPSYNFVWDNRASYAYG